MAVIVGTGFGGIGMAIKLREAGITDFVVLEKSDQIGGTWRDNTYPGAACDVPSPLYSFSFEQDFDWPRFYSQQPDIHRYLLHCATRYGLMSHIRLNTQVQRARFDEANGLWLIDTTCGATLHARAFITAVGQLSNPAYPNLPGLDSFRGKVFHSARWDHSYDFRGKRVAIVGTGASAIQFIAPVANQAAHATVFQRSAAYVLPKPDRRTTRAEYWLYRKIPFLRKLLRDTVYCAHELLGVGLFKFPLLLSPIMALWKLHLRLSIKDPALRATLTPGYPIGCKRILLDNTYYRALAQPNVNVKAGAVREVGATMIVADDGTPHEVDAVILGTGFTASDFLTPMEIRGRDDRELNATWSDGAEAYLGITVNGFPNFFMLYGPNTNLGHNSIVYMLECQIAYVIDALCHLRAAPAISFDIKPHVQSAFNQKLHHALGKSVWSQGCSSWYLNAKGKHTNNWSGSTFKYRRLTRRFDIANYETLTAAPKPSEITRNTAVTGGVLF